MSEVFRSLPSVDIVLRRLGGTGEGAAPPRSVAVRATREVLATAREAVRRGELPPPPDEIERRVRRRLEEWRHPQLRRVINATGVVLHTNLGRAPLSKAALEAMLTLASGYSNLEFDLARGERGSRQSILATLLRDLLGVEGAIVVNNNASAVLLALAALARGRDVLVSRGQLVEIGGGFRIPDVLNQSGARLVEVGTTNRTYAEDYDAACTPETAAILRVHPSNFAQQGFVHQPSLVELVDIARRRNVLIIDDLGSGALLDTARYGLAHEPMVQESLAAGVDAVCFSGDKLLGGPQCGVVVGARSPVQEMRRHPLARAVRIDKASLAALEVTLRHYLWDEAEMLVPVWWMISRSLEELTTRARAWQQILLGQGVPAELLPGRSTIGGGSLPGETLPTTLVALTGTRVDVLAAALRGGSPAVAARIQDERLLIDPRTVLPEENGALVACVVAAWQQTLE
ncbi:MAG: L-seryl-tRNA(Sec) selenium transferase [Chloroflexi bacterium]|nr:L-seryl-tRNA(Sec) selenium transferase [Chloroflexota bacterium]